MATFKGVFMAHFRITPLEEKSILNSHELTRIEKDGSTTWLFIQERFRLGRGFIYSGACLPDLGDVVAYVHTNEGEEESSNLEDSISLEITATAGVSEDELDTIRKLYQENGASWIYEDGHNWNVEDDILEISEPYIVEFVESDGSLIKVFELK